MFFILIQHPWNGPFIGFFGWALTPPNIFQSCWNFYQRYSPIRKTLFKKSFKILNFSINGRHLKFTVLLLFWAQFTTGKPKILLKTKMSTKTTSLRISNSVRLRPQNSCKIKQTRNIFWAQTWSKLPSFSFGVFFVLGFTWKKHYVFLV